MAATVKTQNKKIEVSVTGENRLEKVTTGVSQVGIGLVVMSAGLIGVWALASIIMAVSRSGGLVALAKSWLSAITGM